jgi:uncharacterized protein YkwD
MYQVVAGCMALCLLGFAAPGAGARETYASFVARVNAGLPAGENFRPDLEKLLLQLANSYRASKGLPALKAAPDLTPAARAHAADMAEHDFVGHRASLGQEFEGRMRALNPGVMMLPMMGENAARERSAGPADAAKAKKLFQQWLDSPSHARALRSRDFAFSALGVVEREGKLFADQIFRGPQVHTGILGNAGPAMNEAPASGDAPGGAGLY